MLTSLGEKLTNEEVDELLKGMDLKGSDQVNYFGKYPLPPPPPPHLVHQLTWWGQILSR